MLLSCIYVLYILVSFLPLAVFQFSCAPQRFVPNSFVSFSASAFCLAISATALSLTSNIQVCYTLIMANISLPVAAF